MSRRRAAWIGWSIVACTATVPVLLVGVSVPAEEKLEGDLLVLPLVSLFALVCVIVGALVVSRQPSNAIGWLFSASGGIAALSLPPSLLFELDPTRGSGGALQVVAWATSWTWILGVPVVLFVLLLFPDGRLPSRGWRPVAWLAVAATVVFGAGAAFEPGSARGLSGRSRTRSRSATSPRRCSSAWASSSPRRHSPLRSRRSPIAIAAPERWRGSRSSASRQRGADRLLRGRGRGGDRPRRSRSRQRHFIVGIAAIPVAVVVAMRRYRLYDVDR